MTRAPIYITENRAKARTMRAFLKRTTGFEPATLSLEGESASRQAASPATAAAELRGFVRLGLRLRQGFQPDRREGSTNPLRRGRGPRGARLRLRQFDLLPRSAGAVGDGRVILWARESVAPPGDEQTRAVGADVEGARLVIAERRAVLAFHP